MKKIKIGILLLLISFFMVPTLTYAEVDEDGFETVAENTKYYKTITTYNNNFFSLDSILGGTSESFEITEEEYLKASSLPQQVQIRGETTIETTYKLMTTYLQSNGSYYRYKNVLNWKSFPSVRSFDVIGIGFLGSVKPRSGTTGFELKYCRNGYGCTTTSFGTVYQTFSNGASAVFMLPTYTDLYSLRITYYFDVEKVNSSATISHQAAYGDYAHAINSGTTVVNALNHEVLQSYGIEFASSVINKFDSIPVADVYWDGTW